MSRLLENKNAIVYGGGGGIGGGAARTFAREGARPRLAQVADAAALLASDRPPGITGPIVNVTCGHFPG